MIFDKVNAKERLDLAFSNNSELELLSVIKDNSFLFSDVYSRQWGIQPNFSEVSFGSLYRCDFCWLNDNSDGPEWVLVEIEKPKMKLFTKKWEPTAELNHAIEQVKSWDRYFQQNPAEKDRIFGSVSRFRLLLIAGSKEDWEAPEAKIWRAHHNSESKIEIRSMDTLYKSLARFKEDPSNLSFEQHPKSKRASELSNYCRDYAYLNSWKVTLDSNV